MRKTLTTILILFLSFNIIVAQDSTKVIRLNISDEEDDFAPFVWNDNLVFTSERQPKGLGFDYRDLKHESRPSSLFKAKFINDSLFKDPDVLSRYIQSNHSDGPASFTSDGKYMYYSRPHDIGNSASARNNENNHLGIYKAEWDGDRWGNIEVLSFSDTAYNCSHPAISPNGDFIVFTSNLPGGKGRADLFISRKVNGQWSTPEPLNNEINTKKNDWFPYISYNGDLYFASDRKGDYDIYRCKVKVDGWEAPIVLPKPINSKADDYSIYLDNRGSKGYFSSNREGSFDLYYFELPERELECDSMIEESFCYTFPPIESEELEGLPLKFEWAINGEKPIPEDQIVYCFPDTGRYSVKLNIIDTVEHQVIFTKEVYEFLVGRLEQPYIHIPDEIRVNEWVDFDAEGSYLPKIKMEEFIWDFGDGEEAKGEKVRHLYQETGTYRVSLTIYGAPIDGMFSQFCSYRYIEVTEDADIVSDSPINEPLDLKAFMRLIEYESLPEDLYYLNLIGSSDNVMMIKIFESENFIPKSDSLFAGFQDSTKIHIFKNDEYSYTYYYGASFTIKEAYYDLVAARNAGFENASIQNFKYTKLKNDDYYLNPVEESENFYAVVLKRSDEPIKDFKKEFKKVPGELGEVREIYIKGEGYYYVVGNSEEINEAFAVYSELRFEGVSPVRVQDFKEEDMLALYDNLSPSQKTNSYMIELFQADDYVAASDSIYEVLSDKKVLGLRVKKKKVAYFVNGGSSLLEAKAELLEMKKRGFKNARISTFEYEKLNNDGFYISKMDDGSFSYILTIDSSDAPLKVEEVYSSLLLGYKVFEYYDPATKKYYYQLDVGKNLPEAVMLSNSLKNDSTLLKRINKLYYEPLNDDEFYLDPLNDGDEQYVLVLGSYKDKQNVFKTFKGFSACSEIREFYDDLNKEYLYIVGGYENLEDVFVEMEKCHDMGMEGAYIRKFIFDPLDPDQFYLQEVNEESELFRITINRTGNDDSNEKSTTSTYDDLRDDGEVIDSYDKETKEFVVSFGSSKSLPNALNDLGTAIQKGYSTAQIQRFIYSSMDQDRFAIRDLGKEDRFMCVELFHSDSLLSPTDPKLRELSRKYPISISYNQETKDYAYVIGPLFNVEGSLKFLEMAKADGYSNAKIMAMIYETLAQDDFYLEEMKDEQSEFVLTILQTKNRVALDNVYFNSIPTGLEVSELLDLETGYYNYMLRNLSDINMADSLFTIIAKEGYPNVRLELLKFDKLKPDQYTLETISTAGDDYTIALFRSKEQIGTDNAMFDDIKKEAKVYEYYNYKTKEFIYSLGKIRGMINAFNRMEIARKYGFEDATIDRFVYSLLNPDHFSLEPIDENEPIFTIIIENGSKKFDKSHFKNIEDAGFEVREKYIPGLKRWTYSIGLTENIAEANRIVELAKSMGYKNAELSRFIYMPLNDDKYYLSKMEDIETAYMLELESSEKPLDMAEERFVNINGIYQVSEVYDPIAKRYKYYAGRAVYDQAYAEAFKQELIAMGFENVRISKFTYSSLKVDEYYLDPIVMDVKPYVLEDKGNFELYVYFGFDQYFLTKEALEKLNNFYEKHYDVKYQILLEGYTDSIGDESYNMWLSRKRALSVKKYLLAVGVPEKNISLIAKGESDPIFIKPNIEDHKKSRRVLLRSYRIKEGEQ